MTNKLFIALIAAFILYFIGSYLYKKPKFRTGEKIPTIEAQLMDGSDFSLTSLKGKYVLVDFWGSWCPPCRQENPELVKLYKKFNDKKFQKADGFEILSIAIEQSEKSWKSAIAKDGLDWPFHIVQLDRFNSPLPKEFGVREIPTKYLLNEKGQIISVNATVDVLDKMLTERM